MKQRFLKNPLAYIFLIIVAAMILNILSRYHLIIWDEAVYLGMGKWIYSAGQAGIWEWIRPLGLPLILGALWKTGLNYLLLSELLMLLFALGAVAITYLIAQKIFNRKTAFLAALLMFITPVFFFNSMQIMTGIPSLFFILVAVFFVMEKKYKLAGLFSLIAFLFRYPAGLVFIAINMIFLYDMLKRKKSLNRMLRTFFSYNAVFLLGIAAFLLYNRLFFGQYLGPLMLASKHQSSIIGNIPGFLANLLYYPYTLIITDIFIVFALFFKPAKRAYNAWIPLAVFLLYFTAIPHKQPRFAILFLPYLMMFASAGFFNSIALLRKYTRKRRAIILLFVFLLSVLIAYPVFIDYQLYSRLPIKEPSFVDDYYRYFENFNGTILTSDPVPAAYTDSRYIGYYNNISDAHRVYDANIGHSDAVIYTSSSFPCFNLKCNVSKILLENKIMQDTMLVYNKTWCGELKRVYVK